MSQIFTKFVIPLAIGIIGGIVAYFATQSFNEAHSHENSDNSNRRPRRRDSNSYSPNNSWTTRNNDVVEEEEESTRLRQNSEKSKDEECCGVCLEQFSELKKSESGIWSTPCGHLYCKSCLVESLKRQPFCPICRNNLRFNDARRIYL